MYYISLIEEDEVNDNKSNSDDEEDDSKNKGNIMPTIIFDI